VKWNTNESEVSNSEQNILMWRTILVSINVVPTSHRYLPEDTRTQVLQLEILVRKLGTIDRLSTISITSCYISTLNPEVIILPFGFFDTMEWRSLVMQWLARYADSFLACKQSIVGYK
jgi:hypothetical protein